MLSLVFLFRVPKWSFSFYVFDILKMTEKGQEKHGDLEPRSGICSLYDIAKMQFLATFTILHDGDLSFFFKAGAAIIINVF